MYFRIKNHQIKFTTTTIILLSCACTLPYMVLFLCQVLVLLFLGLFHKTERDPQKLL